MDKRIKIALFKSAVIGLFVASIFWVGCNGAGDNGQQSLQLARVGSTYLTLDDAKRNISAFAFSQDSAKAIQNYREQWIKRQILLSEAQNLNLPDQPEIQNRIDRAREEVLMRALKDVIISRYTGDNEISDEQAQVHFQQHQDQLMLNERYIKFKHLQNTDLSAMRQARNWIENDSSWAKVLTQFDQNPQEKIYQSQRYHPVSTVFNDIPVMKQYASSLDSSQISPIQRYQGIYHLIQIVDVREAGQPANASWFLDELKQWLMQEKQRKYYNSYVKNLYLEARENNEIEVFNVNKSTN